MDHTLLVSLFHYAYFVGSAILVIMMYMIAQFYRKKLSEEAMSKGFIVALVFIIIATLGEAISVISFDGLTTSISSAIAGIAIIINVTTLYQSMRQVHK